MRVSSYNIDVRFEAQPSTTHGQCHFCILLFTCHDSFKNEKEHTIGRRQIPSKGFLHLELLHSRENNLLSDVKCAIVPCTYVYYIYIYTNCIHKL